jgi:hypothetical protein
MLTAFVIGELYEPIFLTDELVSEAGVERGREIAEEYGLAIQEA